MTVKHFLQLVLTKVRMNLKSEANKSYLSYAWWILEPALFIGVFYLVFGVFMAQGGFDFLIFLICGQIPFLWFARSVTNTSTSIEQGQGLMLQINMPKLLFPLVTLCQDFVKSCVVFLLLLFLLITLGVEPSLTWLYLPLLILIQLIVIATFAIWAAFIVPFFPDFKFLVATGVQLAMFGSGIFYQYEDVLLEQHHSLFLLNPVAELIRQFRMVLIDGIPPDFISLTNMALASGVFLLGGIAAVRAYDQHLPKVLSK